jgi:hypothetical protein
MLIYPSRSFLAGSVLSSLWPTPLSYNSASGLRAAVKKRVFLITCIGIALGCPSVAAGIVAPVELGEGVQLGPPIDATFQYVKDDSIFGEKTPPRDSYMLTRVCADSFLPCPGVDPQDFTLMPLDPPYAPEPIVVRQYEPYVLRNISDCLESGVSAEGDLRSSPFDIQFRQFMTFSNENGTAGNASSHSPNTTEGYIQLEDFTMAEKFELREGIIIDAINGAIGFRNHTVPIEPFMKHGATWKENILWMDLETACVDTNWTMEYSNKLLAFDPFEPLSWADSPELVDRNDRNPGKGSYVPWYDNTDAQSNPNLMGRAHLAAWIFGRTISQLIERSTSRTGWETQQAVSPYWIGQWIYPHIRPRIFLGQMGEVSRLYGAPKILPISSTYSPRLDANKMGHIISDASLRAALGNFDRPVLFSEISKLQPLSRYSHSDIPNTTCNVDETDGVQVKFCEGSGPLDKPSIDFIDVTCAFLITPPQRKRTSSPTYNSIPRWQQSIHVCASVPRASVKEVSFFYKDAGAPSLTHLSVTNVQAKRYSSKKDKPIWAIENPGPGWYISNIKSLWGIVAEKFKNSPRLWTFQKEHLYLPAYRYAEDVLFYRRLTEGDSMVRIHA